MTSNPCPHCLGRGYDEDSDYAEITTVHCGWCRGTGRQRTIEEIDAEREAIRTENARIDAAQTAQKAD